LASDGSVTFTSTNDNASQSLTLGTTPAANTVALSGTRDFALVTPAGVRGQADRRCASQTSCQPDQPVNKLSSRSRRRRRTLHSRHQSADGDDLKLTSRDRQSTLNIKGVTFNAAGLGLAPLVTGTDFLDNSSANATIAKTTNASNLLRTEAFDPRLELSIVQIRQDFSKNLINVLQTGSSNLTRPTPREAANSQALSPGSRLLCQRLALANQSQQSVLSLLQ